MYSDPKSVIIRNGWVRAYLMDFFLDSATVVVNWGVGRVNWADGVIVSILVWVNLYILIRFVRGLACLVEGLSLIDATILCRG